MTDYFTKEHLLRLYARAPDAFWRHDVDVSLDAAVKLAQFAHLAGVSATFYVMATSEWYNPFAPAAEGQLAEIVGLDHRLGMHVDYRSRMGVHADVTPVTTLGWIRSAVARAEYLFVSAYPHLIDTGLVSFHMPPPEVLWRDFDDFESAYEKRWDGRYLSDARREWNDNKEARVGNGMQIALHAEHWFPMEVSTCEP
jgi:hypothetical protein